MVTTEPRVISLFVHTGVSDEQIKAAFDKLIQSPPGPKAAVAIEWVDGGGAHTSARSTNFMEVTPAYKPE